MAELLRCFVAIELNDELRTAIRALQEQLARTLPKGCVRWVAPGSIHLTLKFLGDAPATRIPAVEEAVRAACEPCPRFSFAVEGAGCFPNTRRPSVVWVGVSEPTGSLREVQRGVERALSPLGFPPEERAFTPHLTVGRARREAPLADLGAVGRHMASLDVGTLGKVGVSQIKLIRSELLPGGSRYTPLACVSLCGRSEP